MEETGQQNHGEVVIYQSTDGLAKIDVLLQGETVWLTQDQIASLFGKAKSTISEHIRNIFQEGELDRASVIRNFRTTATDGKQYATNYFNLDVIISVGYRVHSQQGVQFRQWATRRIHEYIVKGFTIDDERLKGNAGGNYWRELLYRIRDIRTDERLIYRQVLDLYATSYDYDKTAEESKRFFAAYQNKFHCMYMKDYLDLLDNLIRANDRPILESKGKISFEAAKEYAENEYKKYKQRTLSPAEEDYMETIRALNATAKQQARK